MSSRRRLHGTIAVALGFQVIIACGPATPPTFDSARAWDHLLKQCAYGPRTPGSAARDSTASYITRTLEEAGAEVSLQRFSIDDPYGDGPLVLVNVIANFHPERKKRVLLCAHYDSRPRADQDPDSLSRDRPIIGANDGASGVAVLLELGRLVGQSAPPGIGVDLAFFDGEDYGKEGDLQYYLLGSKRFVAEFPGYRPDCGILLDMVGGKGTRIAKEAYSRQYAGRVLNDLFERAGRLGLDFFHPVDGGGIYDDHVPFLQAGIQMVDLFGYDYAAWHTHADTPDACSADLLGQVGTLLVDFLYHYPF